MNFDPLTIGIAALGLTIMFGGPAFRYLRSLLPVRKPRAVSTSPEVCIDDLLEIFLASSPSENDRMLVASAVELLVEYKVASSVRKHFPNLEKHNGENTPNN